MTCLTMKHHYIPEFYTKRWAVADDSKVCQFTLHSMGVSPNRKAPAAIGYLEDLYAIPGAPPEISAYLEARYFRQTDQEGCLALDALLSGKLNQMSASLKIGWARFMMSLLHRTPEKIIWYGKVWKGMHAEAAVDARAEIERNNGDLSQLADFEETFAASFVQVLQNIMDSTLIGQHLVNMRWGVIKLHQHQRLMTSDRPLLIMNGLQRPDAQVAIPLSPSDLFIATNKEDILQQAGEMNSKELSEQSNHHIVSQAERYVYSADDSQLRFVSKRLGREPSQFLAPTHLLQKYPR
jgi:hypothetical protein